MKGILNWESMDPRSRLAVRNIAWSAVLRGGYLLSTFFLVPLTLGYLGSDYLYGVWLTLWSVVSWSYQLDFGIGNGLRNRLAEAVASGDYARGRSFIATALFSMALIAAGIYAAILLLTAVVDWNSVFGVSAEMVPDFTAIFLISAGLFCVAMVFRLTSSIYNALQLPAVSELLLFCGGILSIAGVYALRLTGYGSLMHVALMMSLMPLVPYLIALPATFRRRPSLSPKLTDIKRAYFSPLVTVAGKFMVIQLAYMVVFMTPTLIVSRMFGPVEAGGFELILKYLSIVIIGFNILLAPLWSANTEAYVRGDNGWIRTAARRTLAIWFAATALVVVMVLVAPWFFRLWVGDQITIAPGISLWVGAFVVLQTLALVCCNVINGCGKITIQFICAIVQIVAFVPLSTVLGHRFGMAGVAMAMTAMNALIILWVPIQSRRIINGTARGLWNR